MSETITEYHGHRIRILREPYRRTLKLTVEVRGDWRLRVGRTVSQWQIQQFLEQNREWIEKTSKHFAQERQKYPPKTFSSGESFLFLGQERILEFLSFDGRKPQVVIGEKTLSVFVPLELWQDSFTSHPPTTPAKSATPAPPAGPVPHPDFQPLIAKKYEQQARKLLPERLALWSERTGLKPSALSLRAQRSRWGSLSSSGRMSLNWKLMAAPLEVIDYVIIHELCHIVHANHSRRFWGLVASWDPLYKDHRVWLRTHHLAFDFLASAPEPKD